ncbi:hypothetical protein ASE06_11605 [Sphingopyxis sp. Root214]|nr:hypothetical protein ASD73_09255 [Sphingopyxis sp. Root154]KRC07221.1 hypothetical protein ASE06_11605 [Sphingopyxis sp. Root214]
MSSILERNEQISRIRKTLECIIPSSRQVMGYMEAKILGYSIGYLVLIRVCSRDANNDRNDKILKQAPKPVRHLQASIDMK